MRELSLNEIHEIQLGILKDVADFCEKNNIEYFLNAGTLLGSVRHKGFIPWDDDIDIEMPREDYERFLKEYRSKHNYQVISAYSNPEYFFPVAKVISLDTIVERYRRSNIRLGINIDIFPIDYFQSMEQIEKIHHKISPFRKLIGLSAYMRLNDMKKRLGIKAYLLWPLVSPKLINFYAKTIDRLAKAHHNGDGNLLVAIVAPGFKTTQVMKRSDIFPVRKEGLFEGMTFPVPNNTDYFLSCLYGDYMVLPPIEKQKPPHHHKAYSIKENISIKQTIKEELEFGSVDVMISDEDFQAVGFYYGDSCNIFFSNGKTYSDVPFYNGYHGRTNELAVVAYYGEGNIKIARCNGQPIWPEVGCKEGESVLIELNERGKYSKEQKAMNIHHSNNIADYNSPEEFSNFRVLKGGKLKPNLFYRGASPVNNLYNRAGVVDELLEKYGIRIIFNLADTEERTLDYIRNTDVPINNFMSFCEDGRVISVGINCAYRTKPFARKIVTMFKDMMNCAGPYYITCTEGKTRTGFVCMLLECIAGYSVEELKEDYMMSYRYYFGITEDTYPDSYSAILHLRFYDDVTWLCGIDNIDELKNCNLSKAAKDYLANGGMTENEYRCFQSFVTDNKNHHERKAHQQ